MLASNSSSVFVYQDQSSRQAFVLAVSLDTANDDLYFHMSTTLGSAWFEFGIGEEMQDSLMFIAYPDATNAGMSLLQMMDRASD